MIAALATLAFVVALWLTVVALAATLGGSRSKVLAALRGQSMLAAAAPTPVLLRFSRRQHLQRPLRARPQWRAAA